jgi:hypothetical protein
VSIYTGEFDFLVFLVLGENSLEALAGILIGDILLLGSFKEDR